MIKGIGVDIIEIERIGKSITTLGQSFLEKIFTPDEIGYCMAKANAAQHFAARFAAKEAMSKALATGWRGDFAWRNVEVMNDDMGKPYIALSGALKERLARSSLFVSLSHSASHVVAMVVIEEHPS
jgi:holo-[acyl-carrier protein] synthase